MSNRDWQVGNRVQRTNSDNTFTAGSVSERVMAERTGSFFNRVTSTYEKTEKYLDKIVVKWDDGTEDTQGIWAVEKEDSDLDREFRKAAPLILAQIDEKLAIASKAIAEAEAIAEEKGIPFYSNVSPLSQSYMTRSFEALWDGVGDNVVQEVTQAYNDNGGYYGWVHSSVC